ncbi:MAG: AAA family ATPase [Proteobacteria bacterium]|nr:AAA family ATPase [Pseudomonadota bacterium]
MVTTAVQKAVRRRSPARPAPLSAPSEPLEQLRRQIAAIRVRSAAARQAAMGSIPDNAPLVPVFEVPLTNYEALVGDRDVEKREERIRAVLNERGNLRVLGAVAGPSLANSLAQLATSHPNFRAAVDYLLGEEALARRSGGALTGLRLLLTGGPGVGKTDFCLRLGELLGVPVQVISMSSAQAAASLGGSETYWSNSKPGLVFESIVQGSIANPLFMLDECEKAAKNWGDPLGALYQLAEPHTAARFCDKSVPWLPIDASRVNWVLTANHPEQLHEALRSRFVEIPVGAPSEASLRSLCQKLYANLLAEFQLIERFPERLSREYEDILIRGNVRDAKRLLRAALAQALRFDLPEVVISPTQEDDRPGRIGFV